MLQDHTLRLLARKGMLEICTGIWMLLTCVVRQPETIKVPLLWMQDLGQCLALQAVEATALLAPAQQAPCLVASL